MIRLKAYCKINLGLRILGKRPDGYHNIETVFHRIEPFDLIELEPSEKLLFRCTDPSLPADETNLCMKAAIALKARSGNKSGAVISLEKKIPVGAGLGGGSSDAASTLLGLVRLWDIKLSGDDLFDIASRLGSDVPYFLRPGSASAKGRGEILEYFELKIPYWILVVYPGIPISTSWAYGALSEAGARKHPRPEGAGVPLREILLSNMHEPRNFNHLLENDFEPLILHGEKELGYLKLFLYSEGALFCQMSGSGSALYALFSSQDEADAVRQKLEPKYRVFITPAGFQAGD